jgi:uncharacterized lipoprotein YddW (UPF0748 family)
VRAYLRTVAGLFLALGCLVCLPPPGPAEATDGAQTRAEEWLQSEASDFAAGTLSNLTILEEGGGALALAWNGEGYVPTGLYTSTTRQTGILFNAVGVQWHAQLPEDTDLRVSVRVSADSTTWSPWAEVVEPQRDGSHYYAPMPVMVEASRYLQYRLQFSTVEPRVTPCLEDITLTFIDSRGGPDLQAVESLGLQAQPEPGGVSRPAIISRADWGANESYRFDSNGNEVWPTEYQTPQKIIIHHSVTQNSDPNPPATVRAIYYYHAITLGWGDVGYNYLVDWKGNIYEGRYGGPEVVGGHAYSYNYGSVGVCGMGTYGNTSNSVAPSAELLAGLADVSAWQCSRVLLDPRESSFFVDKVTQNIAGHRDFNATACPGDYLYAQLPSLRSEVWDRIVEETPEHWAIFLDYTAPAMLRTGETATASVSLQNGGTLTWLAQGSDRVEVGYRWRDAQGTVISGQPRTLLPHDVSYGQKVQVNNVSIVAPDQPGRYTLVLDLAHRGVGWFSVQGSPTAKVTVIVYDPDSWQKTFLPLVALGHSPSPPSANLEARALWVPRWSYSSAADVRSIVNKAAGANFNILLFQVRGQADAYYRSQYEPWADRLTGTLGQDPGWDPLATAVEEAHKAGLELHAYVNVYPVWLGSEAPPANTTPQHMYHQFNNLYGNEWVQWGEDGTSMELNSSYLTASPGHPAVADHIVAVCRDILQNYDVDGLHLDYVRYSGPAYSHDPVSEQRFAQAQPVAWADWQRAQITQLVSRLYSKVAKLRPQAALSVAAWPIYKDKWGWVTYGAVKYDGYDGYYQDSRGWLREGIADFLAPMLYGTSVQNYLDRYQTLVQDFVNESYGRYIYVGIHAGYSDFSEIERRIEIAREAGAQGQAIFSYSLVDGNDYWDDFRNGPYAEPAQVPPMPWKD